MIALFCIDGVYPVTKVAWWDTRGIMPLLEWPGQIYVYTHRYLARQYLKFRYSHDRYNSRVTGHLEKSES